jgi:hypothetical protein
MKNLLLVCLLLISSLGFCQEIQSSNDLNLSITPVFSPQIEKLSPEIQNALTNAINKILLKNNVSTSNDQSKFIIVANLVEETKDISSGVPTMYGYTLALNLYIGDGKDGKLFTSTSITLKGLDKSEIKAYLGAIRGINPNLPQLKKFVDESKVKISEYYNNQCATIIKESNSLVAQRNYDEAIFRLSEIPKIATTCYDNSLVLIEEVYNKKMSNECSTSVNKAKAELTKKNHEEALLILSEIPVNTSCSSQITALNIEIQNSLCENNLAKAKAAFVNKNIEEASTYLSSIVSSSSCSNEANKLINEIKAWVKQNDNKEWELKKIQIKNEATAENNRLRAAKAIAQMYAKSMPKVIYKYSWY